MVFSGPPEAAASPVLGSEMGIPSPKARPLSGCLSALTQKLTGARAKEEAPDQVSRSTLELCGARRREVAWPEADRIDGAGLKVGSRDTHPEPRHSKAESLLTRFRWVTFPISSGPGILRGSDL